MTDGYLRLISTVGQTTVPFFPVVIFFRWFEKHSQPDDCTFFFTVVIFSGHNWCLYFDSNTNYGTYDRTKLLPEKRYSRLAGYVFWRVQITTGKNYDWKKRFSRLADSWNKSQITVCRVKIQTPINTKLEKNYDRKKRYSRLVVGWSTKHKTQHTQTQQPTRWAMPPYPPVASPPLYLTLCLSFCMSVRAKRVE